MSVIGIDIAKNVFQLHGIDNQGKVVSKGAGESKVDSDHHID